MKALFEYICRNYNKSKGENFSNHILGKKIRHDLPNELFQSLDLNNNKFKITGSIGQGQWAEIPWISIFLKDITTSATNGYYIVYLFKSDMSGFYLSLNQGWTYFEKKYKTKEGKVKIKQSADIIRNILSPLYNTFTETTINLNASGNLGKGYELGHICGCYYDSNNIPSTEKLIADLKELITEYMKLKKIIGNRTAAEFNDFILLNSDGSFLDNTEDDLKFTVKAQDIISDSLSKQYQLSPKEIIDSPISKPKPIIKNNGTKTWPRNASIAANSIIHSNYKCTFDNNHISFTSNKTKMPYMEPHHLIPLSEQSRFSVSLDVEANIVSLCSNCHNCVHYGIDEERLLILKQLYECRRDRLAKCGINISLNDLLTLYKAPINVSK